MTTAENRLPEDPPFAFTNVPAELRVAALTVSLAQVTEKSGTGKWGHVRFTPDDLQEIRYASLLHDFGKVGVREPVLVKAEKLYPHEFDILKVRFELARKDRQLPRPCAGWTRFACAGPTSSSTSRPKRTRGSPGT